MKKNKVTKDCQNNNYFDKSYVCDKLLIQKNSILSSFKKICKIDMWS